MNGWASRAKGDGVTPDRVTAAEIAADDTWQAGFEAGWKACCAEAWRLRRLDGTAPSAASPVSVYTSHFGGLPEPWRVLST